MKYQLMNEPTRQFHRRQRRIGCGIVVLIVVLLLCGLYIHGRTNRIEYETAIVNARENFPAIQAELEEGLAQLIPLLEERKENNISLLGSYYIKKDREECVAEYGEEVVEIAERLLEIADIYSISYGLGNFWLKIKASGTGYVRYIYQPNNPGEYQEQLADNWYLNYGPYV